MSFHAISPETLEWMTRPPDEGEPARHVAELSDVAKFAHTRANLWRYEHSRCTSVKEIDRFGRAIERLHAEHAQAQAQASIDRAGAGIHQARTPPGEGDLSRRTSPASGKSKALVVLVAEGEPVLGAVPAGHRVRADLAGHAA
jgi:hypothetical protein